MVLIIDLYKNCLLGQYKKIPRLSSPPAPLPPEQILFCKLTI